MAEMWDMKKAHFGGAVLAVTTLALAAFSIGSKYWADYDNEWSASVLCDIRYRFNWGLYTYDSTTEYVCSSNTVFKRERLNYVMNCDTVDDDNCDDLRTAQYTSSITLALAALNLVLYLALAHYGSVSPNFLALSAVLTCIQVVTAFTSVGAFSAIVQNYDKVEVTYDPGTGTTTSTFDIDISTSDSWSVMVAAGVLSVVQFLISSVNVYTGKTQLAQMPAAVRAVI